MIIIVIQSCNNVDVKTKDSNTVDSDTLMVKVENEYLLKKRILRSGDKSAYFELNRYYNLYLQDKEFFYYTLIMASRYNDNCAKYHLYQTLEEFSTPSDAKVENDSAIFFLKSYFLLKSHELGCEESKYRYSDFIKKYGDKKSLYYLLKYDEYISTTHPPRPHWIDSSNDGRYRKNTLD